MGEMGEIPLRLWRDLPHQGRHHVVPSGLLGCGVQRSQKSEASHHQCSNRCSDVSDASPQAKHQLARQRESVHCSHWALGRGTTADHGTRTHRDAGADVEAEGDVTCLGPGWGGGVSLVSAGSIGAVTPAAAHTAWPTSRQQVTDDRRRAATARCESESGSDLALARRRAAHLNRHMGSLCRGRVPSCRDRAAGDHWRMEMARSGGPW